MSQNQRSQHNRRGSDSEQVRGEEIRSSNTSNQDMRPRHEEDVQRGRGRLVEWTSRLLAIDYDRNAE